MAFLEKNERSIIKTITYRILIIVSNGIVVFFFTRDSGQALKIISWASLFSTFIYFAHERAWNHVHWGKQPIKKA